MLSRKIPNCAGNLQSLTIMRLSSNRLSGVIQRSLALIPSLFCSNLNDNNFIGELPQELGNLQGLEVLDLVDNKFFGNIPKWIGKNLTSLLVLRLHKSNFIVRIPPSLCKTSTLQILYLAYNLMGTILRCVGKLNSMIESHSRIVYPFDINHDNNVIQFMKDVDIEYTTTWRIVFNMDLSSNKLMGEVLVKLTTLFCCWV
ncbi:unnamed protein product [Lactuca saligna]|uniref:Non-specific serine/threonine protein kinase n=1 Tax=Lactuca saligna TaxID=75948 RepID=A0AA35UXQ3_LACSI|nr:unnamed protein product [Lactuca saligna]